MLPFLGIQLIYVAIAVLKIELIHNSADNVKELSGCYDYIVVGLGSAGSVVAMRLAEDLNIRVIGLEAGITQSALTDIPPLFPLLTNSLYDWKFKNIPQKHIGFAFNEHRIPQPRGRVIGGSSVINYLVYNRGNRKDYDNWAKTYGAIGWDYNNILKYFIKAENNSDLELVRNNPGYHGISGPVGISSPSNPSPYLLDVMRAMNSLGFKTIDINGAQQLGTAIFQSFIKDGLRSSTANSYLEPNPYPNNLFISLNSYVTKILIENSTAVGVEFVKFNKTYKVYTTKEVIICAGAIQSPQILMLSGIGPKDHLNQMGIPVIADLPVGDNLRDHNIMNLLAKIREPNTVSTSNPSELKISDLYQLYGNKSGILSQAPEFITYYSTKNNEDISLPNTAIFALISTFGSDITSFTTQFDPIVRNQWIQYYSQFKNSIVLNLYPFLGRIKSLGTIRLNSNNPFDPPLIDPKYLSNQIDFDSYVEIVRFVFLILETTLSSMVTISELPIPGCSYCTNISISKCDPYLKCLIRQIGNSCHHPIGSCRMGSGNRTDVVVDERLRVKGIKKLRVIDASIMPEIPNGNTNAPTIMIGEHGSDLIKADNY